MQLKHGTLEGVILSSLWELEKQGSVTNTVKEVYEQINNNIKEKRAYTTVKTVMDRLVTKKLLKREKVGKKFVYKPILSHHEIILKALNEVAHRYCFGDLEKLHCIFSENMKKRQQDSKVLRQ